MIDGTISPQIPIKTPCLYSALSESPVYAVSHHPPHIPIENLITNPQPHSLFSEPWVAVVQSCSPTSAPHMAWPKVASESPQLVSCNHRT